MTQPPLHGTNPHGQGTVAITQLVPDNNRPYGGDPTGKPNNETLVVGRARGEQLANGTYHGHITVAAIAGNEILGVDTNPGEAKTGPLSAAQQGLLTPLCNATGNQICLSLVTANSTTTATGSTNHFETAHATLGTVQGVDASAASSDGNITQTGSCQTSTGASQVATANVGGLTPVLADAVKSSTVSTACNNGTAPTQTNTSSVVNLRGAGVPVPPPPGCANGVANTVTGVPLVLPIVCNADDTNGAQATAPYGVREALDAYVLATGAVAAVKASTAASESLATAPPCPAGTTGTSPNCKPAPCPAGQTGTQPNCVPTTCPAGFKGTQPNCVPIACPSGTKGTQPNCVPINNGKCADPNDNDCVTDNHGARIPEGGPADRSRDCATGAENTSNCPGGPGGGPGASAASAKTRGTLPFTGYDAIPIVLAGMALLGGGLVLRRRLGRVN